MNVDINNIINKFESFHSIVSRRVYISGAAKSSERFNFYSRQYENFNENHNRLLNIFFQLLLLLFFFSIDVPIKLNDPIFCRNFQFNRP